MSYSCVVIGLQSGGSHQCKLSKKSPKTDLLKPLPTDLKCIRSVLSLNYLCVSRYEARLRFVSYHAMLKSKPAVALQLSSFIHIHTLISLITCTIHTCTLKAMYCISQRFYRRFFLHCLVKTGLPAQKLLSIWLTF